MLALIMLALTESVPVVARQADADDSTSLLTFGDDVLVCGNPTQALRAKRERRNAARPPSSTDSVARASSASCEQSLDGYARFDGHSGAAALRRGSSATSPESQAEAEFLDALYRYKLESAIVGDSGEAISDASSDDGGVGQVELQLYDLE